MQYPICSVMYFIHQTYLMLLKTIDMSLIDYDRKVGRAMFESENSNRDYRKTDLWVQVVLCVFKFLSIPFRRIRE